MVNVSYKVKFEIKSGEEYFMVRQEGKNGVYDVIQYYMGSYYSIDDCGSISGLGMVVVGVLGQGSRRLQVSEVINYISFLGWGSSFLCRVWVGVVFWFWGFCMLWLC